MQNSNSDGAGYENAIINGQMANKSDGGSGTKKVISCQHADSSHVRRHAIFCFQQQGLAVGDCPAMYEIVCSDFHMVQASTPSVFAVARDCCGCAGRSCEQLGVHQSHIDCLAHFTIRTS